MRLRLTVLALLALATAPAAPAEASTLPAIDHPDKGVAVALGTSGFWTGALDGYFGNFFGGLAAMQPMPGSGQEGPPRYGAIRAGVRTNDLAGWRLGALLSFGVGDARESDAVTQATGGRIYYTPQGFISPAFAYSSPEARFFGMPFRWRGTIGPVFGPGFVFLSPAGFPFNWNQEVAFPLGTPQLELTLGLHGYPDLGLRGRF